MKIGLCRLVVCSLFAVATGLSAHADAQSGWTSNDAATVRHVETAKAEGESSCAKYAAWFMDAGRVMNHAGQSVMRPLKKDGLSVCKNVCDTDGVWDAVVHIALAFLIIVVLPLSIIFLAQWAYRAVVNVVCKVLDRVLMLRIDPTSEFFYFLAYFIASFLFASCSTFAVADGAGWKDCWVLVFGILTTTVCFSLAVWLHFFKREIEKRRAESREAAAEEPEPPEPDKQDEPAKPNKPDIPDAPADPTEPPKPVEPPHEPTEPTVDNGRGCACELA